MRKLNERTSTATATASVKEIRERLERSAAAQSLGINKCFIKNSFVFSYFLFFS